MKRLIALVLVCALLLSACAPSGGQRIEPEASQTPARVTETTPSIEEDVPIPEPAEPDFVEQEEPAEAGPEASDVQPEFQTILPEYNSLSDPALLDCVEDSIYAELVNELPADYFVENVSAVYISNEYLEELSYNSQSNIFFGYTLAELDEQFQGTRYVFTLGETGETTVEEFEAYDDTLMRVAKNVAIGTGVILVCVTVSAVAGAAGAPAIAMIFAMSAKGGTIAALSAGGLGAIGAGIITGLETQDFDQSMRAAALIGSEGFKYGAIIGALVGGTVEKEYLRLATLSGLTIDQAAEIQKNSKYSLDVIKRIGSMNEYELYKKLGLTEKVVNGRRILMRDDIDWNFQSDLAGKTVTNLELIAAGYAPIEPATGKPYELHHINQDVDAPLAILTQKEHDDYTTILHRQGKPSVHKILGNEWDRQRKSIWKAIAAMIGG